MARNAFTRRWSVFARGSEDHCRQVFFIEDRGGPSLPYDDVKLVPPKTQRKGNE